jgi:hypothetical protein
VALKRFNNHTSEQDEASQIGEYGDENSWTKLQKVFNTAVADKAKVEAKHLSASLHFL